MEPGTIDEGDQWFSDVIARARVGEDAAFVELVEWLHGPLVGFLRGRGAVDPMGSANAVFAKAFLALDSFEGDRGQFRAWVYRITRNLLIDEQRQSARRVQAIPVDPDELDEPAAPEDSHDPEMTERIEMMLDRLTDEQREVLLLRVVAGLSVEETAEAVDRRPGAVRALQHRALNRLRRSLVKEVERHGR